MTAPTLFSHDAPHITRKPRTDRLVLLRLLLATRVTVGGSLFLKPRRR